MRSVTRAAVALLLLMIATAPAIAAPEPAIQITAPSNGAMFTTGQTIDVTASVTAPQAFTAFALVGERHLGAVGPVMHPQSAPTFTLTIPARLTPGPYALTVIGYGPNSTVVAEAAIQVQIESPPLTLLGLTQLSSNALVFEAIGERLPIRIRGAAQDGGLIDLTQSSHLTYLSADPTIGTVDSNGMVTAMRGGQTSVNVALDTGSSALVPVRVLAPALTPAATLLSFGDQAMGVASATKSVTITNTANYALKILSVHSSPDFSETDDCVSSSPIAINSSCTVTIGFTPLAQGARIGFVSLANAAVIAPTRVILDGTGTATDRAHARVTPDEIDFGKVKAGERATEELTIRNVGKVTLNGYITPVGGSFAIVKGGGLFIVSRGRSHHVKLALNAGAEIKMTQEPVVAGRVKHLPTFISTTLNITTSDSAHPSFSIKLHGRLE